MQKDDKGGDRRTKMGIKGDGAEREDNGEIGV